MDCLKGCQIRVRNGTDYMAISFMELLLNKMGITIEVHEEFPAKSNERKRDAVRESLGDIPEIRE
jgi:hypothetical protein